MTLFDKRILKSVNELVTDKSLTPVRMLCANFSPELDAVETNEVGLSIASPEEPNGCAGKRAESKTTSDTNACVRDTKNPMMNTALTPILK